MDRSPLALVVILAVLSTAVWIPGPLVGHVDAFSPSATPNVIQQTSVAYRHYSAQGSMTQVSTPSYGTTSVWANVSTALPGVVVASVYSSSLQITASMHNGFVPMLNVSQGTVTLANATVPYWFPITPVVSVTPVVVKVPAAFTSVGNVPPDGFTYPVYYNFSQSTTYLSTSTPVWTFTNGSRENLSYTIVPPTGYIVNQTTVFVPFPVGAYANLTTFKVTKTISAVTTNLSTYQWVQGGILALIPGTSVPVTLNVAYTVLGTATGTTPVLPIGPVYPVSGGFFQTNASWVNDRALPYAGQYYITYDSSRYSIVPGSLTLTANLKPIVNSTYALTGSSIIVLAGSVTVAVGRPVVFQATFELAGLVPHATLCVTCPAYAGASFSLGTVIGFVELVLIAFVVVRGRTVRAHGIATDSWAGMFRHGDPAWWAAVFLFSAIAGIYAVALIAGG